uniref:Uncharacterized protein n=1 Tax=Lactuca sativa TaxID=4236 RepID=A0A9R1UHP9_LACSA|nr:hypothetical protein LSAT_V11C900480560 [Lactuca sativa]
MKCTSPIEKKKTMCSVEVEYMAMVGTTCEVLGLRIGFRLYVASWMFVIFTVQLEGECFGFLYLSTSYVNLRLVLRFLFILEVYLIDTNLQLVPPFDKHNFSDWKSKSMEVLEFMDFDMFDVVNKGPIVAMHQSSNDGASNSKLKGKSVPGYNKEEKRMLNLDVKARLDIGNSLPFSVYCLVQNCSTVQEITTTLSSAFEKENSSDNEVKCFLTHIVESHTDTSHDCVWILNVDSPRTAKDLKSEWDDTSAYQS